VLVNMSTSCFRRYEGAMRESGRFFDAAPTLPGLEHRDLANLFLAEIVPDRAGGELGVRAA